MKSDIDIKISNLAIENQYMMITDDCKNEFEILKENVEKIMNKDIIDLNETTERYVRYVNEIDDWLAYDYLKNEISDFFSEQNKEKKYQLMVSIDMTLFKFLR